MGKHQTIALEIDGMTCAGCVARAEKAISAVAGVDKAEVNLATRGGKVILAENAGADTLRAVSGALRAAGYPAVPHRQRLQIKGMSCATCVAKVETALLSVPGVQAATVNLADATAAVTTLADNTNDLIAAVKAAGYGAEPLASGERPVDHAAEESAALRRRLIWAAALTLPVFVLEMGGHLFPAFHHWLAMTLGTQQSWLIQFALATVVMAFPGRAFFVKGVPALLRAAPDMNSLVALGTSAAWGFSTVATFAPSVLPAGTAAVYFEAAAVIITLILLGRLLEARAKGRTGAAIKRLVGLRPATALVERDGAAVETPVEEIRRGDMIQIRAGERIAVDGVLREGTSWVDESMITGEPVPVEKTKGALLVGGTVNGNGALRMRATAVGSDTMLARIIDMVQEAQSARLPVQDLVNKITVWFVPAIMGIAVVTVGLWLAFGPAPALPYALVAGVAVLIIACPCAMGLATPTSIMVGTGRAAEIGVLFRQGDALQGLQAVQTVAFDKTGTLTEGRPDLTDIRVLGAMTADELLATTAALEALSEHPIGGAILRAAKAKSLPLPPVNGLETIPGHGLRGHIGGAEVLVGAARLMDRQGIDAAEARQIADEFAARGRTPVVVAVAGRIAGVLGVADRIKPEARAAIAALHARGLRTAMITGDTQATAKAVAADLGIDQVLAEVLPEGKVAAIRQLQQNGRVAFVGDGINDAPALAAADVGIAIGTGTDVAVESAQVVLMSGDPSGVVNAIEISRRTLANIRENLVWAFGYNVILVPVAAGALYPVWGTMLSPALAAGAMAVSSVLVVSNALRLRFVAPVLRKEARA